MTGREMGGLCALPEPPLDLPLGLTTFSLFLLAPTFSKDVSNTFRMVFLSRDHLVLTVNRFLGEISFSFVIIARGLQGKLSSVKITILKVLCSHGGLSLWISTIIRIRFLYRGSNTSAHVLLKLLNELRKNISWHQFNDHRLVAQLEVFFSSDYL